MTAIESPSTEYVESRGLHKVGNLRAGRTDDGTKITYIDLPGGQTRFNFYFNKHYQNDVKLVMSGDTTHYKHVTTIPRYNIYKIGGKSTIALPRYTKHKLPFLFMPKTAIRRGQFRKGHKSTKTQRDYYIFGVTNKHVIVPSKSAMYFDVRGRYG